ncbi:MAG: ribonuclease R [Sphingomonadales bacterium]
MTKNKTQPPFPTREDILSYIQDSVGNNSKRKIAKAFHIRGEDRVKLKAIIKDLISEGYVAKDLGKSLRPTTDLPTVTLVEIIDPDRYGDLLAKPANWHEETTPPRIFVEITKRGKAQSLGRGDKALVRLTKAYDEEGVYYDGSIIRAITSAPKTLLGIFTKDDKGGHLTPTDKKNRSEYFVLKDDNKGTPSGTLVMAEQIDSKRERQTVGLKRARIIESIGDIDSAKSISLIAIHKNEIPVEFSPKALKEAGLAKPCPLGKRIDLRHIPFITIDPVDARDHDDAMFAEADPSPKNKGGWHLMVAIADVAHYVKPKSALDKDAQTRGNSCYFPDRVVPMLPEILSTNLCSLLPNKDRAAMVAHLWVTKGGKLINQKFERAIIRSIANINYEDIQRAVDEQPDDQTGPLLNNVILPLYGGYEALIEDHKYREPLALELPEKKVILNEEGDVDYIGIRERLTAHKVVEEYMILANVAAAIFLENHKTPCIYRVHEEPSLAGIEALNEFLKTLNLKISKGNIIKPALFNGVLRQVKGTPHQQLVNDVILRSQTQAYYSPNNQGHFGLSLPRYGHFTSPIRRYSDLLVHRGIIRALELGSDGLDPMDDEKLETIAEHISATERRAMVAERETTDRYLASFLYEKIGEVFKGRISGVAKFGLFISLEPSGADGFIPISTIGNDYFYYDEDKYSLIGKRMGETYQLGDKVEVKLLEANKMTGGIKLELYDDESKVKSNFIKRRQQPYKGSLKNKPKSKKNKGRSRI